MLDYLRRRFAVRRFIVLFAHVALYALSYLIAWLVRFDFTLPEGYGTQILVGVITITVFRTVAGFPFKLYGGVLKYAGMRDMMDILKAMTLATAAFVVATVLLGFRNMPRSIIAIDWVGSIVLIGGLRFSLRAMREMVSPSQPEGTGRKRVAIIGAGDAGETLVRDIQRMYRDRYYVVGFLDDDTSKMGLRIHDVPVIGPIQYLGDYVPRYGIEEVIVAIPTATGEDMRRIVSICKIAGVHPKTIPGVDQLIDGRVTVNQIRDVAIEDILGRDPVELEEGLIRRFIHDKVVMVTGAGGSIGSELCRQICRYHPRKLILVEQSEPHLFSIHRELGLTNQEIKTNPVIADVTDKDRIEGIFHRQGPEVIFHAAAHKHVPMMEFNPGEAIKNNVLGTRTVANAAHAFGAKAFVFVSTDKAVNPTSIMGASKRVSEMYVQALSCTSKTKFTAVRFGNVLGSTGSVIPIFKEQIAKGGPVTVTDPEMRRYFMTIPESCQLVMQAAAMGEGGEIFVLDMGEPVKIVDLARDLITLSGFEPDLDIKIAYTGVRPGEKMFEEIGFDEEKMSKTRHPKVYVGKLSPHPLDKVNRNIDVLVEYVNEESIEKVRGALKMVVPEFDPEGTSIYEPGTKAPVSEQVEQAFRPECPPALPAPGRAGTEPVPMQEPVSDVVLSDVPVPDETEPPPAAPATAAARPGQAAGGPKETEAVPEKPPETTLAARDKGDGRNPVFDEVWDTFVGMCREKGFVGASWKTTGVRPPDVRRATFDGDTGEIGVVRRSVSITPLSFVELSFHYAGKTGKHTPPEIRSLSKSIGIQLAREIRRLGQYLED